MTRVDLEHGLEGVRLYVDGEDFGIFKDESSAVWYLVFNRLLPTVTIHRSVDE